MIILLNQRILGLTDSEEEEEVAKDTEYNCSVDSLNVPGFLIFNHYIQGS